MYRRILIGLLALALIILLVYKQNGNPFTADKYDVTERSASAVNEEMQNAFDAGKGVWLVFSSDS